MAVLCAEDFWYSCFKSAWLTTSFSGWRPAFIWVWKCHFFIVEKGQEWLTTSESDRSSIISLLFKVKSPCFGSHLWQDSWSALDLRFFMMWLRQRWTGFVLLPKSHVQRPCSWFAIDQIVSQRCLKSDNCGVSVDG